MSDVKTPRVGDIVLYHQDEGYEVPANGSWVHPAIVTAVFRIVSERPPLVNLTVFFDLRGAECRSSAAHRSTVTNPSLSYWMWPEERAGAGRE